MSTLLADRRFHLALSSLLAVLVVFFLYNRSTSPSFSILKTPPFVPDQAKTFVHYDESSPLVPAWNRPPAQHVPEATPLMIGFTRAWPVLEQCVVSYIAAGWPPSDIYVVENTGTMQSNQLNQLSPDNPFYLDYHYLTRTLGVNVLTAPTYLSFAQLQNFFLYTSIVNHWPQYFWSHMDVAVVTNEVYKPFSSLYMRAVDALRETANDPSWGIRFFAYDKLTLARTAAYSAVGGFDTFIPYYNTDCDFHFRINQAGFNVSDVHAGAVHDLGGTLPDLSMFYRRNTSASFATCKDRDIEHAAESGIADVSADPTAYGRGDCRYFALQRMLSHLADVKNTHKGGRNFWQNEQQGGEGEPFWTYPNGFEKALWMHVEHGKRVYAKKWGWAGCGLGGPGNRTCKDAKTCDAWRVDPKQISV